MYLVSWKDIDSFIFNLKALHEQHHFTGVYGIPRGGVVLAAMASYKLDIPMLMAPCKGCLIVDDIADTGNSLRHYVPNRTNENKYFIATVSYSAHSAVTPQYYQHVKVDGQWVVFPWESVIDTESEIKS